jgi:hypothetical protein
MQRRTTIKAQTCAAQLCHADSATHLFRVLAELSYARPAVDGPRHRHQHCWQRLPFTGSRELLRVWCIKKEEAYEKYVFENAFPLVYSKGRKARGSYNDLPVSADNDCPDIGVDEKEEKEERRHTRGQFTGCNM